MPVTAKEIAEMCGVSRGSVDRALNNRPGINPETRRKILETAQSLGYKPDFLAKSLVTGKTNTIGVVVFDVSSHFFGQLVHAIETHARKSGYFVYLTVTDKDSFTEKQCIEHLSMRKVDGLILVSINKGTDFENSLKTLELPVVTIVNRVGNAFDYIGIDDRAAISDAVRFIAEQGHREILYVTTPMEAKDTSNMYAVEKRLEGFLSACTQLGIPGGSQHVIAAKNYTEVVWNRLRSQNPPTAILCSNDFYALEVMNYLKGKGVKIPGDVSVMGFDNIDTLRYIEPGLTTISYPIGQLGEQAVDLLLGRVSHINTKAGYSTLLNHHIVRRDSVREPPPPAFIPISHP